MKIFSLLILVNMFLVGCSHNTSTRTVDNQFPSQERKIASSLSNISDCNKLQGFSIAIQSPVIECSTDWGANAVQFRSLIDTVKRSSELLKVDLSTSIESQEIKLALNSIAENLDNSIEGMKRVQGGQRYSECKALQVAIKNLGRNMVDLANISCSSK